jgi:hypothetical protein
MNKTITETSKNTKITTGRTTNIDEDYFITKDDQEKLQNNPMKISIRQSRNHGKNDTTIQRNEKTSRLLHTLQTEINFFSPGGIGKRTFLELPIATYRPDLT